MTSRKPEPAEPYDKYELIQIRWIDSFCTHSATWEDAEAYARDCEDILTVGYFLEQTSRYIIVAQSIGTMEDNNQLGGVWRIPVGSVQQITQLS